MPDNRPAVYAEGDNIIYRASALGHCLRSLWAARSGMDRRPIPEIIKRGMDEGTALEPIILDLLYTKHGFSFGYQGQQFVVELNLGAWNGKTLWVRGSVDEIGGPPGYPEVPIDVKALPESDVTQLMVKGITAKPNYAWQTSCYIHGYRSEFMFMPIFHKGTWEIEEWSLEPIKPTYTIDQIRDRVLQVEEAFYAGTMPEQCNGDFACVYPYLHDQNVIETLPEQPALVARARIWLSQRIDNLTTARKALDDKLKQELGESGKFTIDGWTISIFDNPDRFNTDAAKQLLTEAEIDWQNDPVYWTPGEGQQIRFTKPKKGKDSGS
jgi:hypothetical protein